MSETNPKNKTKKNPPPFPNGTIISQRTNGVQWRKLKMLRYKMATKDFLLEIRANNTLSTFYSFQSGLRRYGREMAADGFEDPDCEYALSVTSLNTYKFALAARGLLGQSINGALCPIKSLVAYLIRMKVMTEEENPFLKMASPEVKQPVRLLVSDEEVMKLLESAERQNDPQKVAFARLLLSTLVHTGARAQEVVNIQRDHVYLDKEILEIRDGKGGKNRFLHPPSEWWIAYKAWLPFLNKMECEHSFIFASGRRSHISDERLRAMLEELKAIGGLKGRQNIKPHSLRHWFASHMHTNGGTIPMIQAALGHAHPSITWKYIHNQANGTEAMKQFASFAPEGWGTEAGIDPLSTPRPAVATKLQPQTKPAPAKKQWSRPHGAPLRQRPGVR